MARASASERERGIVHQAQGRETLQRRCRRGAAIPRRGAIAGRSDARRARGLAPGGRPGLDGGCTARLQKAERGGIASLRSRPRPVPSAADARFDALGLWGSLSAGPVSSGPGFPLLPPRPRGLGASGLPTFRLHTDPSGPSHSLPSASPRVLDGLSTFFSTFTFSNALWQADDWRMRTHEVCTHAIGSLGRLKLRMSVSSGGRGLQLLARGCVRPPVRRRRSHRVIAASTGKTARMSGANMPPGPLGPVREGVMTVTGAGTWSAGSTIAPQQRRTRGAAAPFGER